MNCGYVKCAMTKCKEDEISVTKPGNCCPECVKGVCPPKPPCIGCESCPGGYNDGCNSCACDINGKAICTKKACLVKNKPYCTQDCTKVFCIQSICNKNEISTVLPGDCCPTCIPS